MSVSRLGCKLIQHSNGPRSTDKSGHADKSSFSMAHDLDGVTVLGAVAEANVQLDLLVTDAPVAIVAEGF